ncbi:MAG TPA: F0F1 ATP synthase subunit A [Chitinivibrionales bacterium]|nr:F0F1 ATP synthase subunit A [Chitinivibrionales bacterium]
MEQNEFLLLQWLGAPCLPFLTPHESLVVWYTWLAMTVIVALIIVTVARLRRVPGGVQNAIESLTAFIEGYLADIVGPKGPAYFPLVVSIMLFVLVASYIGLIPGMLSPTGYLSTPAAVAITVFLFYNYVGISKHGLKHFKHFLGPVPAMAPIMIPIEIISEFARPLSLSLRLFSNIFAGETIIKILFAFCALVAPTTWMLVDSVVTIPIQGFVFSLLTMVYLSGAVASDEGH